MGSVTIISIITAHEKVDIDFLIVGSYLRQPCHANISDTMEDAVQARGEPTHRYHADGSSILILSWVKMACAPILTLAKMDLTTRSNI